MKTKEKKCQWCKFGGYDSSTGFGYCMCESEEADDREDGKNCICFEDGVEDEN